MECFTICIGKKTKKKPTNINGDKFNKAVGMGSQDAQRICDDVTKSRGVTHACLISYPEGALKAWSPSNFLPENTTIKDIISAFQGDTDGLAERGINVGCGISVSTPSKLDEGLAIIGSDGLGGGTSAFLSNTYILLLVQNKEVSPLISSRIGYELMDDLKNAGR